MAELLLHGLINSALLLGWHDVRRTMRKIDVSIYD